MRERYAQDGNAGGIALEGELLPCKRCSIIKGFRKPIPASMHPRAVKKLARLFVDMSGPMGVESHRGKRNTILVNDGHSSYTWVHFIVHKSRTAEVFAKFLEDIRTGSVPSMVAIVRLDDGGKFCQRHFGVFSGEM